VNVAHLGATPVLLTGGTVRVLDLVTGERLGAATGGDAATVVEHRGVPVLLTAGFDNVIRVLDLATGQPQPTALAGHTEGVSSLAARQIEGRTVVASLSYDDTVRLWDLDTGQPIGSPLPAEPDVVGFVDIAGRPAVVAAGLSSIRAWDAITGAPIGTPIQAQRMFGQGLPVGTVAGRTIAVTASPYLGHVYIGLHDLATGTQVGELAIESADLQSPVTVVELGGRALLLHADGAEIVQYDLLTGSQVGDRLTGHEADVDSLKVITAEGRIYLLSGSADRSVRVWDLTARNGG
jgi:WD40 repeat protein